MGETVLHQQGTLLDAQAHAVSDEHQGLVRGDVLGEDYADLTCLPELARDERLRFLIVLADADIVVASCSVFVGKEKMC